MAPLWNRFGRFSMAIALETMIPGCICLPGSCLNDVSSLGLDLFFFRAVYTAGAQAGHLKDMRMGDFGVILSVEGVFASHMLPRAVFG